MKKFLFFVLLLLIALAIIGYFLPTQYSITKRITINAPKTEIHNYVGDLHKWKEWTVWDGKDPDVVITTGEKTTGIGANQSWQDNHGGGSLVFTAWSPDKGVEYDLFFQAGKYKSKSKIEYSSKSNDRTEVKWTLHGDTQTPILGGYFSLYIQYSVGSMFEQGLSQLKFKIEKAK